METTSASRTFRLIEDIPFAQAVNETGQLETLKLDIYLPEPVPAPPPRTIVLFHGGGFLVGNDKRQFYVVHLAKLFAAAGYAVVAPDYRVRQHLAIDADWSAVLHDGIEDGREALAWLRQNGAEYGLNPTNLVMGGGSAGGILVNNLVHSPQSPLTPEDQVSALLCLWGPPMPNARLFDQLNPACPPTFLVHGTGDDIVPYENCLWLVQKLEAAGIPYQLMTLPGAPHPPAAYLDQIGAEILGFLGHY